MKQVDKQVYNYKAMKDRIMASEVWCYEGCLGYHHVTGKKSNEEVSWAAGVEWTMMKRIRQRQLAFLGCIMRKYGLENLVVTGMGEWKRSEGATESEIEV